MRLEELRLKADEKQAELEEILLQLNREKGKMAAQDEFENLGSESGEDEDYDGADPPSDDESTRMENEEVRLQPEHAGAKRSKVSSRLHYAPVSISEPPHLRGQRPPRSYPDETVHLGKATRRIERFVLSSSSSGDENITRRVKRSKKHRSNNEMVVRGDVRQEAPVDATRMLARKALGQISASPFVRGITDAEPPRKFQAPRFNLYDGKSDPLAHYRHYTQMMALWSCDTSLMCRVFPSSLGDTALQWFHRLPPFSIESWEQLAEEFVTRFLANTKQPKTADVLLTMRRKLGESLRDYSRRYMELYNEVEGCSEQLAVTSFKLGLKKEDRLWLSLTKKPATSMSDLMCRIEKYAKVEDEIRPAEQKEGRIQSGRRPEAKGQRVGQFNESKSVFEAINTVFKEPIFRILPLIRNKPYFKRPAKLPDFPGKADHKDYCSYHQDRGHRTGFCRSLRQHLEELVAQGHLKEFIDETRRGDAANAPRQPARNQRRERDNMTEEFVEGQAPPRVRARNEVERPAVIHVIHMEQRPQSVTTIGRTEEHRCGSSKEVCGVSGSSNKRLRGRVTPGIVFAEDDHAEVRQPHNDALVLTLKMFQSDVKRILVDAGSSTEVMFLGLFKKLGLTEQDLEPAECPLIGFNSAPVWPLGRVVVPVKVGPVEQEVEFTVVDSPSSYNAIVGRSWIHSLGAVPSTYHQVLKFPFGGEVIEVRGDQNASKRCFTAALRSKSLPE